MSDGLEICFSTNGQEIKLQWRLFGTGPLSKPLKLNSGLIRDRCRSLRQTLTALNEYVIQHNGLNEERDPGWTAYDACLQRIKTEGRGLRSAIFRPDDPHAGALAEALEALPPNSHLDVSCSDTDVTLPLNFVYSGADITPRTPGKPSIDDFSLFWLNRYRITMFVEGSGCPRDRLEVASGSATALYALHKRELENSSTYLGVDYFEKLGVLTRMKVGGRYDWNSVRSAYQEIAAQDCVVFVFAHSDGDSLVLDQGDKIDCLTFSDMLMLPLKREERVKAEERVKLLILNCCLSASGREGASLLSAVARRGFCGLIGTEAEIANVYALRCGVRLMWGLYRKEKSLGEAFEEMRGDPDLFPLNILYTCYANRDFRLCGPAFDIIEELECA
jgi:hypothetical protein